MRIEINYRSPCFILRLFLLIGMHIWIILPMSASIEEMPQQNSLSSYLSSVHDKLMVLKESGEPPEEIVHVVLGNQSADMDSIVSAITLAFVNADRGLYIPVINILRADLPLRGDVLYVLETLNIDPSLLLYQEDLPFLLNLATQGDVRLTLVDHNLLAHDQKAFENWVERIIDHHKDEKIYYPRMLEDGKIIKKAGSNSTLIAEMMFASASESISSQVAYMLLSAILLDTKDLKNPAVVTEKDIAMVSLLKDRAGEYYKNSLYDVLIKSRNAVEHLTPDLLLKKDYKLYKEGKLFYGIAGIPAGTFWNPENRIQWKGAFEKALEKQQIQLLSALIYDDCTYIVYIPDTKLQAAFLSHLTQTASLTEELMLKSYFPDEGFFFFALKSPLQRKQLQPLLSFEKSLTIQNADF